MNAEEARQRSKEVKAKERAAQLKKDKEEAKWVEKYRKERFPTALAETYEKIKSYVDRGFSGDGDFVNFSYPYGVGEMVADQLKADGYKITSHWFPWESGRGEGPDSEAHTTYYVHW